MKINLYEPGALDELFAQKRAIWGDARMMADPDDDGDPDDDPDDDGDDDGDDDPDEDDGKPYVAPTAEEYAKTQRKLKRQEERITRLLGRRGTPAKKTASGKGKGSIDEQLRAMLRKGKDTQDDPDDDGDESDQAAHWRDVAITNAAAAQISAAGFSGTAKQAARLANLIDKADVEPDRHGAFDLEDQIDELKEEYPQLFSTSVGNGRRAPRLRTAASSDTPKKSGTDATTAKMLKQAGYR